ncbi:MAG: transporter, Spinster family, sphingosine-phosphate transporter [Pseudonocardiales bacterium]|nr:transporter, Spinster family, sphingosine-phosphate transporter [Pseudonocardiales bacterium]
MLELPGAGNAPHVLDGPGSVAVTKRHAWTIFGMAFVLMALDFVDRQVVVATFPYLKSEWGLSDTQLGALVSVVSVSVAVGAFPIGLLADRWSRVKAIAVMGATWSLATLACGFAQSYVQLFAARAAIGVGEAGYAPAAGALLSTVFPARKRATVLGAFQAAAPLGTLLGLVLGGIFAAAWGWRAAFGLVAVPGLILALAFLLLRDYRTVPVGRLAGHLRTTLAQFFRARSGVAAIAGGALQLMVVSTLYTWLPSYLNRSYRLSVDRATNLAGAVILAGMIGTIVFAYVADRAAARDRRGRLRVPAVLSVATFGLLTCAFAFVDPGPWQIALIIAGGLTATAPVGPVAAVVADVVHPDLRATAIACASVAQNLLGLAVGPVLTGVIADHYGLPAALTVIPTACGGAALAFWYGSHRYVSECDAVTSPTTGADS